MEAEHKKLLINNFSFIGFFALLFICYCTVTSWLVGNTDLSQSASLDVRPKKVIVIDPGHGGEDGGAIGINGTLEKDLNLLISDDLSELFQFAGYEVIPTRTEDIMLYDKNANHIGRKKVLDLAARLEIAKNQQKNFVKNIIITAFGEWQAKSCPSPNV
jgi:N-acetylmuramoyl-L-alanine amidase